MLGLFKRNKKKSNASILATQKLRKRRGRSQDASNAKKWRLLPPAVIVAILLASSFFVWNAALRLWNHADQIYQRTAHTLKLPPKTWDLQIVDQSGVPLTDDLRKEVFRVVSKIIQPEWDLNLDSIANAVSSLGIYDKVSIIRPQYRTLIISTTIRSPILLVQNGQTTRYLTGEGHIYGNVSSMPLQAGVNMPEATLVGVLEDRQTNHQTDVSQKLIISPEERTQVLNAIALWHLANKAQLSFKTIQFQNFRGFSLVLKDDSEIVLGVAPFDYKLDKLAGILAKLKGQGVTASRIELDYEGKAFIKERKL